MFFRTSKTEEKRPDDPKKRPAMKPKISDSKKLDPQEEKILKERLKSLGYL